jgi:DNA-binding CsgD family transcriptional regulator
VTDGRYSAIRAGVLAREEPPAELLEECRRIVTLLVRTSGLPPHYSPYGVWSPEAIEEVLASWIAERLIGRGQLLAIMQRAPALPVFRRMAETSVRQHLIDSLKRSQATNLYERLARLLAEDGRFEALGAGPPIWHLRGGREEPFAGGDRELLALAWSLGSFHVIRYQADALKLSPLLDGEELERFAVGMLEAGAMSAATLVRALRMRFAIEDPEIEEELDADLAGGYQQPEGEAIRAELVRATLAELSARQARVLVGISEERSGAELAERLGCSTGTISYERRQIEDILARLGSDAPAVLKLVLDELFIDNG